MRIGFSGLDGSAKRIGYVSQIAGHGAQAFNQDQSCNSIWKCTGDKAADTGPHGMAQQDKVLPCERVSDRYDLVDVIGIVIPYARRPVIRHAVPRQIEAHQLQIRKQRSQPVEGVGIVQPAMQRENRQPIRRPPAFCSQTHMQCADINLLGMRSRQDRVLSTK